MSKRIITFILILCLTTAFSFGAIAKNNSLPTAVVTLDVNEPDEDGYFTALLTVKNAKYIGFQGTLYYNVNAVTPVSFETKEPTDIYSEAVRIATKATSLTNETKEITWLSEIWTAIHKEDGYITFANYTALGQETPNSILNEDRLIVAPEEGLAIYEFSFKKISGEDACFELYQDDEKTPGVIVSAGYENPDVEVVVNQPDSISKKKTENSFYHYEAPVMVSDESEDSPLTIEQRKLVRASGSVFLNIDNYAAVSDGVLVWIDKDNKAVMPYIKDNRTLVPLRFIAESFGAEVGFDDAARTVTITYNDSVLKMVIGDNFYTLDDEKFEMDTSCEITNSRTFVPLRAVAEAFDKSVTWLEADRIVSVNPSNYPWAEENKIEKELLNEIKLMISPMVRDFAYLSESLKNAE